MPKTWSGKEVIRILVREFDFTVVSQKGSHVKLKKFDGRTTCMTIVSLHAELALGTLHGVLRLAGIDFSTFKDAE
jgi:predicted RNA binding protein YcfA (HicA-like mRNA interferase family)